MSQSTHAHERRQKIAELRRQLTGDSLERKNQVEKLVKLVRADEAEQQLLANADLLVRQ
jgi:hypothetical protein